MITLDDLIEIRDRVGHDCKISVEPISDTSVEVRVVAADKYSGQQFSVTREFSNRDYFNGEQRHYINLLKVEARRFFDIKMNPVPVIRDGDLVDFSQVEFDGHI